MEKQELKKYSYDHDFANIEGLTELSLKHGSHRRSILLFILLFPQFEVFIYQWVILVNSSTVKVRSILASISRVLFIRKNNKSKLIPIKLSVTIATSISLHSSALLLT